MKANVKNNASYEVRFWGTASEPATWDLVIEVDCFKSYAIHHVVDMAWKQAISQLQKTPGYRGPMMWERVELERVNDRAQADAVERPMV